MNYRHLYHAGNAADVFKHAVLFVLLQALREEAAPFFALDTHAGLGVYDLNSLEAHSTGEFREGIVRALAHPAPPAALAPFFRAIEALNTGEQPLNAGELAQYPGSLWWIAEALRPQDAATGVELHRDDHKTLQRIMRKHGNLSIHYGDGYEALRVLPFPAQRGVVLIDPPFEAKDETAALTTALSDLQSRWNGMVAVWHPIKQRAHTDAWYQALRATCATPPVFLEHWTHPPFEGRGLSASGMVLFNTPPVISTLLQRDVLPWLAEVLGRNGQGGWRLLS